MSLSANWLSRLRQVVPFGSPVIAAALRETAAGGSAGAAARTRVTTPDYARLFKDGFLPITLAIGFDEANADARERRQVLSGLRQRGFRPIDVRGMSAEAMRAHGIDPALVEGEGRYFIKKFEHAGKEVVALLKYIDRDTPAAVDRFRHGFVNRGLVLYGGHARYGSGPDFDPKESPDGNFVIGQPYDRHMRKILEDKPNELRQNVLTDEYQLMFFSACTSRNYLDELRTLPANKDTSDIDFIGSNEDLYWPEMSENLLGVIDAVMAGSDADSLKQKLVTVNHGVDFTFDGFEEEQGGSSAAQV